MSVPVAEEDPSDIEEDEDLEEADDTSGGWGRWAEPQSWCSQVWSLQILSWHFVLWVQR